MCVSGAQSDLEYGSTTAEKERLQEARERVQSDAGAIVPVLSVMYLQLQLLQNVQESLKVWRAGAIGRSGNGRDQWGGYWIGN